MQLGPLHGSPSLFRHFWAGKGGTQLSSYTTLFCYAKLAVSSLAAAVTAVCTYFTISSRIEGCVDLVGWLHIVDSHSSKYYGGRLIIKLHNSVILLVFQM